MMKLRTLLICVLLSFAFAFAQKAHPQQPESQQGDRIVNAEHPTDDTIQLMRQDIRSQRKQIVATNLSLTEPEAITFWPVYDCYVFRHSPIYDTRYALIKEYAKSYDTMSDGPQFHYALDQDRGTDGPTSIDVDARIRKSGLGEENDNVLPD
jgi:hypothetical protein